MKHYILKKIKSSKPSIIAALIFVPTLLLFYLLEYTIKGSTFLNIMIADSIGVLTVGIYLIIKGGHVPYEKTHSQ